MKYDLSLGDVTPVVYGGFLVDSKSGEAIHWHEPEFDIEEHPGRGIECHRFTVEADAMKDLDWVEWEHIASFTGRDIEEIREAATSADIRDRAQLYEDVGNYYGFINLDCDGEEYTAEELEAMYPET